MSELEFNKEQHVSYILGTKFEDRMFDIYIGMANHNRPPFLEDIFIETTQTQALLLLEGEKRSGFMNRTPKEWERLYDLVWKNEEDAMIQVIQEADSSDLPGIHHDMFRYVTNRRLAVLMRNSASQSHHNASIYHSPVAAVW